MPIFPLLSYYSCQLNVDDSRFIVNVAARIFILYDSIAGQTEIHPIFCTFYSSTLTQTKKFKAYFIRHFDEYQPWPDWTFPLFSGIIKLSKTDEGSSRYATLHTGIHTVCYAAE